MVKLQNLLMVDKVTHMKVDCEELQKDLTMLNEYVLSTQNNLHGKTKPKHTKRMIPYYYSEKNHSR